MAKKTTKQVAGGQGPAAGEEKNGAPMKDVESGAQGMTPIDILRGQEVYLAMIDMDENHRVSHADDEEKILSLMESMRLPHGGQQSSIRVYKKPDFEKLREAWWLNHDGYTDMANPDPSMSPRPYLLGFGARRCQALTRLKQLIVRADIFPPASQAEIESARGIENLEREDINAAGEVLLVSRMMKLLDGDIRQVGYKLNRSEKWVRTRIYLQRMDPDVLGLVAEGRLPLPHARLIAQVGDPDRQRRVASQVMRDWNWDTRGCGVGWDSQTPERGVGSVNVVSLLETKAFVAAETQSLNNVPWLLDRRFDDGKPQLPACIGCRHNTKSDPLLFEGAGDPAAEAGFCLNVVCYSAKQERCDLEKSRVAAKVIKVLESPRVSKKPMAAVIRDADVADWIKPASVQRAAQKAFEEKHPEPAVPGAPGAGTAPAKKPQNTDIQRRNQALVDYAKALDKWRGQTVAKLAEVLVQKPSATICLVILDNVQAWDKMGYHIDTYAWGNTRTPTVPPPIPELSPEQATLIKHLAVGDLKAVITLQEHLDEADVYKNAGDRLRKMPPTALRRLAGELKVDGLGVEPAFEDYLPDDLRTVAPAATGKVPGLALAQSTEEAKS